jgi:hypothetical protein
MDEQSMDTFLDESVYAITDKWYEATGQTLTIEQKYELNDWLTQYFADKA